jgi:hypothetical protein
LVVAGLIAASNYSTLIEHKLSANISAAKREDTQEDSFIHVFRSLNSRSDYTPETEAAHLEYVKNSYGGKRVHWVVANKPLMKYLKQVMEYEYFEQNGKPPVSQYYEWSKQGTRGSVSEFCFDIELTNEPFLFLFCFR